ncbi:hypothetical protein BDN72DRAFT_222629 [Pluteus cervinus]|uniref:Uncharacterized protein n=1 Tax=Pluteus cervinus TaxID=181527 RepID=A0ACD3AHM6_9AGAR|nr:hypothetical protein BDN72DRAFT_222629 [Pluteus cervinus]
MAQRAPPHPILKQHFDSSAVAFTKIDEEIAILQESIRALHAFRNTFTPVYSLPPEVLSRIFSLVRHATSWDMSDKSSTSFKWPVLTSVSQHWRNVAIGSPDLWTHLSNSYPKHVFQEWLQRSKGTPLSIDLYRISPSFAEFITASLPRIRELTFKLSATSWNGLLHSLSFPVKTALVGFRREPVRTHQTPSHTVKSGQFRRL